MNPLQEYFNAIKKAYEAGNATEHTYRPALKKLLESFKDGITATNEPRRVKCGAPDYIVSEQRGQSSLTIGYVEAKNVGVSLDDVQESEQLKRYLRYLPNLILTDYLEFRWFVDGKLRTTARLARVTSDGRLNRDKKGAGEVKGLIQAFLEHAPAPISSPQDLAVRMARLTHMIRDIIIKAIETGNASSTLTDLRKAFAQALVPDLDQPAKTAEFADMYAQTIAYGLFAARCNHRGPGPFSRLGAAREIPKTNPFLRRLFATITGPDLDDEPYAGFVDDLAAVLAQADLAAILEHFGQRTARQDPIVHFYETFLKAYDPQLRERRGVYYTPEPVVSYIVRSVDYLLRQRFGCAEGLADTSTCQFQRKENGLRRTERSPRVLILDPACGTGTFLYAVVDLIRQRFMRRGDAGMWSGYVRKHLLPRLFGFELLMAPYAVAHFKLGMQLAGQDLPSEKLRREWAYDFKGGAQDRLRVYLTNTLEGIERAIPDLFGWYKIISDEANAAREVKRTLPIMVVLGNPPYSGHSANRRWEVKGGRRVPTFIGKLIQDYRMVDGKPLGERNPKWLQDDYVKFIRWGQWRIERTGSGILAFITNHSYLDSPTFRGMRQSLMQTFDEIYLLDLHGNAKKRERVPEDVQRCLGIGQRDENVFEIQQGVAICIMVKLTKKRNARVFHAHLWGTRKRKYRFLQDKDLSTTQWAKLAPQSPFYLFTPQDDGLRSEYQQGWSISEIFPVNSVGIVTARDRLTICWSADEVWQVVRDFAQLPPEKAREKYNLGPDVKDWKVSNAQADVRASGPNRRNIIAVLYRPFDQRFTYYTGQSRGFICRPRPEVMRHMLSGENVALTVGRAGQVIDQAEWNILFCSKKITEFNLYRRGGNCLFPLYLYPDLEKEGELFANEAVRHPNLNPKFVEEVAQKLNLKFIRDGSGDLKKTFGPEDVLHYIYAVLHSPTYRQRYAQFLRIDFPRVPLTSDCDLFRKLCQLGRELVSLHLLESPQLNRSKFITRYPVSGDNRVERGYPRYFAPGEPEPGTGKSLQAGRVYINPDEPREGKKGQYFEGVPPEVWEFHIGGYQVCQKWLKDRRGRTLSYEELIHYQKIVLALKETLRLMDDIDTAISHWPVQ